MSACKEAAALGLFPMKYLLRQNQLWLPCDLVFHASVSWRRLITATGCLKNMAVINTSLVVGASLKFCNWGDGSDTEYMNN